MRIEKNVHILYIYSIEFASGFVLYTYGVIVSIGLVTKYFLDPPPKKKNKKKQTKKKPNVHLGCIRPTIRKNLHVSKWYRFIM